MHKTIELTFSLPFNVFTATLIGPWDMMEHLRESRVVDNRCLEVFADMLSLMMLPSASARYTSPNAPEPSTLPDVKSQKTQLMEF